MIFYYPDKIKFGYHCIKCLADAKTKKQNVVKNNQMEK